MAGSRSGHEINTDIQITQIASTLFNARMLILYGVFNREMFAGWYQSQKSNDFKVKCKKWIDESNAVFNLENWQTQSSDYKKHWSAVMEQMSQVFNAISELRSLLNREIKINNINDVGFNYWLRSMLESQQHVLGIHGQLKAVILPVTAESAIQLVASIRTLQESSWSALVRAQEAPLDAAIKNVNKNAVSILKTYQDIGSQLTSIIEQLQKVLTACYQHYFLKEFEEIMKDAADSPARQPVIEQALAKLVRHDQSIMQRLADKVKEYPEIESRLEQQQEEDKKYEEDLKQAKKIALERQEQRNREAAEKAALSSPAVKGELARKAGDQKLKEARDQFLEGVRNLDAVSAYEVAKLLANENYFQNDPKKVIQVYYLYRLAYGLELDQFKRAAILHAWVDYSKKHISVLTRPLVTDGIVLDNESLKKSILHLKSKPQHYLYGIGECTQILLLELVKGTQSNAYTAARSVLVRDMLYFFEHAYRCAHDNWQRLELIKQKRSNTHLGVLFGEQDAQRLRECTKDKKDLLRDITRLLRQIDGALEEKQAFFAKIQLMVLGSKYSFESQLGKLQDLRFKLHQQRQGQQAQEDIEKTQQKINTLEGELLGKYNLLLNAGIKHDDMYMPAGVLSSLKKLVANIKKAEEAKIHAEDRGTEDDEKITCVVVQGMRA